MFRLKFKLIEQRPVGVVRDRWREICRKAWYIVGNHWYRNFLKQHFTPQARHKYKHQARSTKYKTNKERLAARGIVALGGQVDNVFTGRTMRELMTQAIIRGFPTRVKVSMFGPDYMRIKFKAGTNQPNKKLELITTTADEQRILKRLMREFITKEIKAIRDKRTTNF